MSKLKSRIMSVVLAVSFLFSQVLGIIPLNISASATYSPFKDWEGISGANLDTHAYSLDEIIANWISPDADGTRRIIRCQLYRNELASYAQGYGYTSWATILVDPRIHGRLGAPSGDWSFVKGSETENKYGLYGVYRYSNSERQPALDYDFTYYPNGQTNPICVLAYRYSGAVPAVVGSDYLSLVYTYDSSWLAYGNFKIGGKYSSWDATEAALIICEQDLADYLLGTIVTPTTSFSSTSVTKTYYDAPFDSGFSTDSTGTKTFSSSNTSVATIDNTGKITIVGTGTTQITGSTAANDSYSASSATMTLTVNKATPTLSGVSASAITYGQTLASSVISGTAKVGTTTIDGNFTWKTSSIAPSAGTPAYEYVFTPTDTANINSVTGKTIKVTVNKKGSYITGVTASGITYGQTLNSSVLNHTDGISGTLAWSAPDTKPNAGAQNYVWTFTPTDTTNYAVVTGTTSVSVAKADPTITASPAQGITYGQKLSDAGISGTATGVDGATLSGTWAYQTPDTVPQVSDSGITQYTIVFTPSDANYNSKTITTTVQVSPATLTAADVNVSTTPITYGQTLSASNITATCSKVSGTITWLTGNTKPSVTDSGVTPYAARFTPSSSNYKALDLTATVVVNKASANITTDIQNSLSASDITYGQTLGDSIISGDKPVPGYYTWANPDIAPTVANSNTTEYDVIFIPSDETNYNRSTTKLKLKVNPATLVVTPEIKASIIASQITYGDTLANSTLSGTTPIGVDGQNVAGQYVWVSDTIAPEVSDSDRTKYDVAFKPTDSLNYTEVSGLQATVTVIKATPVITPEMEATISATAITYSQTLADSHLTGTTPIPGHYEWVDNTITPSVADSGVTEYDVRFIPDDAANNNAVEGITCKLIVNKATPDVNSSVLVTISASDITYGDSLADSSITGDLPVNSKGDEVAGSYAWADSSIKPSVSDSELSPYTVIFTPADTDNYTTATFTLTLKVNKADITIPSDIEATITASDIVYEQSLADSTLSGTMPDANGTAITGHYEWADSSIQPSVADSGVTNYEVVFKPDDSINYNDVTGLYTTLIITKLTPSIEPDVIVTLSASGITYGQTLGDSTISGDTPRPGHWEWVDESVMPIVADSNSTDFAINWIPDDADNYNIASTMLSLEVSKATPVIDVSMLTIGDIVWGTRLGDASLTGDYPTLNGSDITGNYSWINPDDILDAGDQSAQVLFTPTDSNNFNTASIEVTVHVNPLVPTFTPEITSSIHASDITYGQTLASAILSGDVPVAGHYEWKFPDTLPTVADSNLTAFDVVFIPDSSNYAQVDLVCTVYVGKKVVQVPDEMKRGIVVGEITYGQHLGDATLTGDTPIPGRYMWIDSNIMPTVDGENRYMVIFVPDDNDNYGLVEVEKKHVIVRKATPVIDMLRVYAQGITYGQSLADSTINTIDPMPGTFSWVDNTIKPTLADSNITLYDAIYHPDDTVNYTDAQISLTVKVNPITTVLPDDIETCIVASAIKFGQSLGDSQIMLITRDSSLPAGSFEWSNPDIKPAMSDSDVTKYPVTFIPADTSYTTANTELTVHVDKADLPTEYLNLTDTVALKPGASTTYSISNKFRLPDASVTGITKTDAHNVLEKADLNGNAVDLTAVASSTVEGHSAEIVFTISSRDYVDATLTLTVVVTACDHSGGTHIVGYKAPTNATPGYTGDVVCNICGATIEFGREIPALQDTCEHAHTHIENAVAANCVTNGYTGDVVCDDCNKVISQGTMIRKTGHLHTHVEGYKEATCKEAGYTGDKYCDDCGAVIKNGTVVPKLSHIEGDAVVIKEATRTETGLKAWYCILCNTQLRTEVIPKLGGTVYPPRPRPEEPDEPTEETEEPTSETEESEEVTSETEESTFETEESEESTSETEEPTSETEESEESTSETEESTSETGESEESTSEETGESEEPTSETGEPDESTSETDNSDDESGETSDNSDTDPEWGIIKQVGIADGEWIHTPDDGHVHNFSSWQISRETPYTMYRHICNSCGLIEEVVSETDPNTWGADSNNPNTGDTGIPLTPICFSGFSSVIVLVAILLSRKKRN